MAENDQPIHLSETASMLLRMMAEYPNRIEYHTSVLGGSFRDSDIERLDQAYEELEEKSFVEKSGSLISFFGQPKSLRKITESGLAFVHNNEDAA